MRSTYNIALSPKLLNAHLRVYAEALRLKRAEGVLKLFEENNLEPDTTTFSILIGMFSRAQRIDRAKEYFEKAKSLGKMDKLTVGPLIDGLARNEKLDEAVELFEEYHQDFILLERHLRFLRLKLHQKGDKRVVLLPEDPNSWRSRENISKQLSALGRDPSARKMQNWLTSVARN
jgi:pentatricopeptide repeat protein